MVVGTAWLLSFVLAAPSWAQLSASLDVRPREALAGATIEVAGHEHPAACGNPVASIRLRVAGIEVDRPLPDLAGQFVSSIDVPDLAPGTHPVTTSCDIGDTPGMAIASAHLVVLPPPPIAEPEESGTAEPESAEVLGVTLDAEVADRADRGSRAERTADGPVGGPVTISPTSTADLPSLAEPTSSRDWLAPERPMPGPVADDRPEGADPVPAAAGTDRWSVVASLPHIADARITPSTASEAALLTALFAILVGFPAALFNSTFRNNYDRIRRGARVPARVASTAALLGRVPSRVVLAASALLGAGAAALADPSIGPDTRSLGILAGSVVTVGLAGWLGWLPTKLLADRRRAPGRYRVYPLALVIAAVCVLATRLAGIEPGYLYGLLFAYVAVGAFTTKDDGVTFAWGFGLVFGLSLLAWTALSYLPPAGQPGPIRLAIDTVLAGLTVAGIEGILFAGLPLSFFPGQKVWAWSRRAWSVMYVAGVLAFAALLSGPRRSLVTDVGAIDDLLRAVLAFGLFGAASIAFWAWFRLRPVTATVPTASTVVEETPTAGPGTSLEADPPSEESVIVLPADDPRVLSRR